MRSAPGRPAGELGPVLAEATPLPPQDGVRAQDHERLSPPGPDSGQPTQKRRSVLRTPASRWSRRVIIELRLWPDQNQQINHLAAGRGFGEGQSLTGF